MNYVEPIRDTNKLEDILMYLEKTNERNYILFNLGLYTGLRISDILRLQVKHVRGKTNIRLKEKKTGKYKNIKINKRLKKVLDKYIENKEDYQYLIYSKKDGVEPMTRQHAWKIIKETCMMFGIDNTGTHSLRKTFGYHYYLKTKNIAVLQNIFNHSEPSVTLRYIGINQDTLSDAYDSMCYF